MAEREPTPRRRRDVTEVLVALPLDILTAMQGNVERKLERARAEVTRLEHERDQLEEAARRPK